MNEAPGCWHTRQVRRSALLLCGCLLAGCDIPFPAPTPPPEPPALPSPEELLAWRPYRVVEPSSYDGGTPLPLVLALHGYGNSSTGLDAEFGLKRLAERRDFLLVMPNALADSRGNRAWHPENETAFPFDREYLRALLLDAKARYAVDPSRVFVFGYSQGGHMAHRLACDSADVVTALVSLAGQAPKARSGCVPVQKVSALQVHGTEDQAIGYSGDATEPIDPRVPSAHETIAVWGRVDECGALTASTRTLDLSFEVDGDETTVEVYADCPPGIGVELWTMNGVQHSPSPQPNFMNVLYGFLAQHPRP